MLNKIVIQGRLVADPELRTTQSGITCCNFSVAVERNYSGKNERATDFLPVLAWRNTAEFLGRYFRKGDLILVEGSLYQEKFQDKEGKKRSILRISAEHVFFCGSRNAGSTTNNAASAGNGQYGNVTQMPYGGEIGSIDSDELPF